MSLTESSGTTQQVFGQSAPAETRPEAFKSSGFLGNNQVTIAVSPILNSFFTSLVHIMGVMDGY